MFFNKLQGFERKKKDADAPSVGNRLMINSKVRTPTIPGICPSAQRSLAHQDLAETRANSTHKSQAELVT